MAAERVARWARAYVAAGAAFLLLALGSVLTALPQRTVVVFSLFGFVLHTVFGKAYSLVPTYFDRSVSKPRLLAAQWPLTVFGTVAMGAASSGIFAVPWLDALGALAWALGVSVFLGVVSWTIRDNLTGAETATGDAAAERQPVDRLANMFVPLALAYLAVGSYAVLAARTGLPVVVDGYLPRATHLLAAGTATLLVFALGFRLLPRFAVATPPRRAVPVVLVSGALGPALVAFGLPGGALLHAGAALESVAVLTFAASVVVLFSRSGRSRVGFYGVLTGLLIGTLGVTLGLVMAFGGLEVRVAMAHARLNLLGFLGLVIVGVTYQFYPPAVGSFTGANNETAGTAIGLLAGGLVVHAAGLVLASDLLVTTGALVAFLGGLTHVALLFGLFVQRYGS